MQINIKRFIQICQSKPYKHKSNKSPNASLGSAFGAKTIICHRASQTSGKAKYTNDKIFEEFNTFGAEELF